MNPENKHFTPLTSQETSRRIIQYASLVDSVQLSVARKLDIEGSLDTDTFADLHDALDAEHQERLFNQVGEQFDEALIDFVVGSLIGHTHHRTTIMASEHDGIDGYLPWESKLQERLQLLHEKHIFTDVAIEVRRHSMEVLATKSLASHLHSPHQQTEHPPLTKKHAA